MHRSPKPYNQAGLTILERLLRFHRWTLRDLVVRTNVPRSTLGRIVKGQWPDVRVAIRIAHSFGVGVEDLWGKSALVKSKEKPVVKNNS